MRESTERSIPIPNIRREVFLLLLEYVYTDTIVEIDIVFAVDLYIAADQYGGLERLKEMCVKVVQRNISTENAGPLLQAAYEFHCDPLKELVMTFVLENFDAVSKSEGIRHVEHGLLLEILSKR
jgi:BTB And C-terminal Kelch/BTB/POZ domain